VDEELLSEARQARRRMMHAECLSLCEEILTEELS
jgi:hypothetical protein